MLLEVVEVWKPVDLFREEDMCVQCRQASLVAKWLYSKRICVWVKPSEVQGCWHTPMLPHLRPHSEGWTQLVVLSEHEAMLETVTYAVSSPHPALLEVRNRDLECRTHPYTPEPFCH